MEKAMTARESDVGDANADGEFVATRPKAGEPWATCCCGCSSWVSADDHSGSLCESGWSSGKRDAAGAVAVRIWTGTRGKNDGAEFSKISCSFRGQKHRCK